MTIGITGGTGLVGQALARKLLSKGYSVVIFSRQKKAGATKGIEYAHWDPVNRIVDTEALRKLDGVVNLAGAGIADKRWTDARKKELISSRYDATLFLIDRLRVDAPDCKLIISASGTGYYGPDRSNGLPFTEDAPAHTDFIGKLCVDWESAALSAADFARVCICRIGLVAANEGGAFPRFKQPIRFGIRPIFGDGRQIMSWIHIDDLTNIFIHLIEQPLSGIFNAVAPEPVTQKMLMDRIGKGLNIPGIPIPIPKLFLKIGLGAMASELLKSCTVSSEKVLKSGFHFEYASIDGAVRQLYRPV